MSARPAAPKGARAAVRSTKGSPVSGDTAYTAPMSLPHDSQAPDPSRCPLCGGDNRCAMEIERETGEKQPPCWCMDATFTAELFARIPVEARGQACICAACVRAK